MPVVNTTDSLQIVLAVGCIIVTACIVYTTYYFVKALKSFQNFIDNIDDVAEGVRNGIKLKTLAAIPALLIALASKVIRKRKGGE